MRFLRTIKYWLSGGKRRWFARKVKSLPAGSSDETASAKGRALGGAVFEVLYVGLEIAPEQALGVCLTCDPHVAEAYSAPSYQADREALLLRAARLASGPAWRVGWTITRRLKQAEHMKTFSRGLAMHWAGDGNADALVMHLDDCRGLEVLDREFLGDVLREFLARASLRDNPSWPAFLEQLPAALLPPFFDVHALLGRALDAVALARTPAQTEEAIRLCLEDNHVDLLQQALILAKGLSTTELRDQVHGALGEVLAEGGDWSGALPHYQAVENFLGQSICHEGLGDLSQALGLCPASEQDRRVRLSERLEQKALEIAGRGDLNGAMSALMSVRGFLAAEADPSPAWLARRGVLERHRAELLKAGRQTWQEKLSAAQPGGQHREALLSWSAFEELAGEWAEAALILEQAGELGDRLRASQLWEKDEQYGEAVRALGPLADRAEVQLRLAQLRESGGDATGAAALFEHLGRWPDARRAYEVAGQWAQAAQCYRQEHGEHRAVQSTEYAHLLVQAQRVDELLELYLEHLDREPGNRLLLDRLRELVQEQESQIQSPRLRAAAVGRLARIVQVDLRQKFERAAAGWIEQAREEILKRHGRIWGMDLGTSKSAVALFDLSRGTAVICPHKGRPHFPSTLSLDKHGNEVAGLDALEQLRPDLRGCIERSKRAMGTRKVYRIGDRQFSPEEVAARLLTHGRGLAEALLRDQVRARVLELARKSLGEDCPPDWMDDDRWADKMAISLPDAVVTIPAYFDFDQRQATRDAAEIAGIKLHRLIAEPTAACLSAGLVRNMKGKMLVVDLGAGTLDLSYLNANYLNNGKGLFDVEKIFGDSQFGSSDFDAVLEKDFVHRMEQAGLGALSGLDRRRLHAAAEELKIALSSSQTATYELVSFAGQGRHTLELTATRLEELLAPHLDHLEKVCRPAADLQMDHLVLVGGPMFSPIIRRHLEQIFQRKADAVVDPRTAVAMGAACQGAILSNHDKVPFVLLDVMPFALGVLAKDGANTLPKVSFHILRGTKIPHLNRKPYSTTEDNQAVVTVQVFQGLGDSTDPAANRRVAQFHLEGLPPAKAGESKIDISFDIDDNGLLKVTASDEKTGRAESLRIADALWLSPAQRSDMTERLTKSQRWARERAELTALVHQVRALVEKLDELDRRGAALAWQGHFAAWQRTQKHASFGHLEPDAQALLAEMYNSGQASCDQFTLNLDRARNLPPRCRRFVDAVGDLNLFAAEAEVEKQLRGLQELGRQLEGQTRDAVTTLEPLAVRFQRWSACLSHCGTLHADPRDRLIACHDAGDWQRAIEAFQQAFAAVPPAEVPLSMVHRHLDGVARLSRREAYRQVLADHRERLALRDLHFDQLNEFGRHVLPGITWVFTRGLGTGSGFLAAPDMVVTNRHVVFEDERPVGPDRIVVRVGGAPRPVARMRFPSNPDIDLAVLELAQPIDGRPVRVGYSSLVEVGERVLVIGFPLPEGDSFEENLLLDHGIVNRIRTRPGHGRELELGLRISRGMSGGPVFNDRGEVIGVSTFVRYQTAGDQQGPVVDKSSHAIAVDALHELLPRPW